MKSFLQFLRESTTTFRSWSQEPDLFDWRADLERDHPSSKSTKTMAGNKTLVGPGESMVGNKTLVGPGESMVGNKTLVGPGESMAPNKTLVGSKLPKSTTIKSPQVPKVTGKLGAGLVGGAVGVALGFASGAKADTIAHSLHPLSVLDSGSLGTDDMMGEPIEFKEPAPKQQKPLPGAQFMFSSKK